MAEFLRYGMVGGDLKAFIGEVLPEIKDGDSIDDAYANYEDEAKTMIAYLKDFGIPNSCGMTLDLHDVFTGEKEGAVRDCIVKTVPSHSCVMLKGKLIHV